MTARRRVVILGHSGFIGSHLAPTLRRSGDLEVIGRSRPDVDLTIRADALSLAALLDDHSALVVCAGIKPTVANATSAFQANLAMATNIAALIEGGAVGTVVFLSSSAVYGEIADMSIAETTPVAPSSDYAIAKHTAERLFQRAADANGKVRLLILRPTSVYGPGDVSRQYGPAAFIDAALRGQTVALWGDGSERRDFVYVEDVCAVVRHLLGTSARGVVNVASGESRSFSEALDLVVKAVGRAPAVASRARTRPKVDQGFDPARVRGIAPGVAFTPLEEGIARTVRAETVPGR